MVGKRALQEIIASIIIILISIPAFIMTFDMPVRVRIFPRFASGAMFVFSAALLIINIVTRKKMETQEAAVSARLMKSPFIAYGIIVIYVILIPIIGFFVSSIIMMIVFMLYMNIRTIRTFLLCIPIVIGLLYVVFAWQLSVPMPKGFLF